MTPRLCVFVLSLCALGSMPLLAKDHDRRLATAKTAFIEAGDPLSDDRPVVACLTDHLTKTTPLTVTDTKASADVVLKVYKTNISGNSMRSMFGSLGLAHLDALAPDGNDAFRLSGFRSTSRVAALPPVR